jgi:hypothetical protein
MSAYSNRLVKSAAALALIFSLLIAVANRDATQKSKTNMSGFSSTEINLGQVEGGKKYEATFDFKGSGKITGVKPGCGCTVPTFSSSSLKAAFTPNKLHAGVTQRFDRKKISVSVEQEDGTITTQDLFIIATVVK